MIASTAVVYLLSCAAAPVPPQKLPRFAVVQAAIGADYRRSTFRSLAQALGPRPTMHKSVWEPNYKGPGHAEDSFHLAWDDRGVECAVEGTEVVAVWLRNKFDYPSVHHRNKAYAGELPAGLTLDDGVAAVIGKMGPPEEPYEAIGPVPASDINPERTETVLAYPSRGLSVWVWKVKGSPKEVIFHVAVEKPRKPERR